MDRFLKLCGEEVDGASFTGGIAGTFTLYPDDEEKSFCFE